MSANGNHPEPDDASMNGHAGPATNGHVESALAEPGRQRTRRFRRRSAGRDAVGRDAAGNGAGAARGESVEVLQAELMLLREENARLAQARHQPPGVAGPLRRAQAARAPEAIAEDSADELAQLVTDYAVMRETLLPACEGMESSLSALRRRLAALPAALAPAEPLTASNGNGSAGAAAAAAVRITIDEGGLP